MTIYEYVGGLTGRELDMQAGDIAASRHQEPPRVEQVPCSKCGRGIPVPRGQEVPKKATCSACEVDPITKARAAGRYPAEALLTALVALGNANNK
jgi:hypothetical protein